MKNYLSLRILSMFRGLFEALGCDFDTMQSILQVKLTMDTRRVPTILSARRNSVQSENANGFFRSLWIYVLMSLVVVPFVLSKGNSLFEMSLAFGMLMFLVMTSMISDFSSVLLDIRDAVIISTKPVRKRTISFARMLHIVIYLTVLTGSLTGLPLIVALLSHGVIFFLVFVVDIVLMDIFILVFTAILYLFILHFFDGERLKDIINYVQIALSIAIVVGYQLIGRAFNVVNLHVTFHEAWWQVFIPPFWFGATFQTTIAAAAGASVVWLSLCAVIVPLLMLAAYIRLMPAFERKLQKLAEGSAEVRTKGRSWTRLMAGLVCASKEERVWFQFAFVMMARERAFKLKVYPSLGLALVFPFIMMFNPAWSANWHGLAATKWYLAIYFCGLMMPTVITMLKYSDQYQAAWIYQTTPLTNVATVYKGTVKAFLLRLFLPVFVIDSVVFVVVFGIRVIPHLIVACLGLWLYAVICSRVLGLALPFADRYQMATKNSKLILLLMLVNGVIVAIDAGFGLLHNGVYLYMAVLVGLNVLCWRYAFQTKSAGIMVGT